MLIDVQDGVHPDDVHPVLPRQVLHGRDPAVALRESRRQPDVHALRVEVEPGEGHVVLPADQPAYPAVLRVHDPQCRPVAHAPDRAFRTGRHQLAVAVDEPTVGREVQERVVDR